MLHIRRSIENIILVILLILGIMAIGAFVIREYALNSLSIVEVHGDHSRKVLDGTATTQSFVRIKNRSFFPISLENLYLSDDNHKLLKMSLSQAGTIDANAECDIMVDEDIYFSLIDKNIFLSEGSEHVLSTWNIEQRAEMAPTFSTPPQ